jgi:TP901 family phage tail tape measure protein
VARNKDLRLRVFGEDVSGSSTLQRLGTHAEKTRKQLAGGLVAKVGAAGVAATIAGIYQVGTAYEDALNQFQSVSGATAEQLDQVGAKAKELGGDLTLPATSAADATTAMLELSKGGFDVAESMEAAKGTLQLAAAAQVDGARAAEIQGAALNQFGLDADQAGRVADVLANTSNAAAGGIEDMANALTYAGPVARAMGVDINDTATAVGLLAKNGILSEKAGTALRGVLGALAAPSEKAAVALDELGVQAFDQQGQFVGLRALTDQLAQAQGRLTEQQFNSNAAIAFGREPLAAIVALANSGTTAYDDMAKAVGRQGGAADVAAARTKGLSGTVAGLTSQAETLAVELFEDVAPALIGVGEGLTALLAAGAPVLGLFGDVIGLTADLVGVLLDHREVAVGLAVVYAASLSPAIATAARNFSLMIRLNVGAMLLTAKGAALQLVAGLRALATAQGAATLGLGAIAAAATSMGLALAEAGDDGRAAIESIFDGADLSNLDDYRDRVEQLRDELGKAYDDASSRNAWDVLSGKAIRAAGDVEVLRKELERQSDTLATVRSNSLALGNVLGMTTSEVERLAKAAGVDLSGSLGEVGDKLFKYHAVSVNAAPGTADLAESLSVMADEAATADDKIQGLKNSLDELLGKKLDLQEATDDYNASMRALAKSAAENGRTLEENTDAGEANRKAIRDAIEALEDKVVAMRENGAGEDRVREAMLRGRDQLIRNATQFGLTKDAAKRYIDQLGLTPENVSTLLTIEGRAKALDDIFDVQAALNSLDGQTATARLLLQGIFPDNYGQPKGKPKAGDIDSVDAYFGRALGGPAWPGSTYLVGERGPEFLTVGARSAITPADATRAVMGGAASGAGGGTIVLEVPVTLDGREVARGTARYTLQELRTMKRSGGTQLGLS